MSGRTTRSTGSAKHRPSTTSRSAAPSDIGALPRFGPSPTAQGEAFAEQILEGFRKDLESISLRPKPHKRTATRGEQG